MLIDGPTCVRLVGEPAAQERGDLLRLAFDEFRDLTLQLVVDAWPDLGRAGLLVRHLAVVHLDHRHRHVPGRQRRRLEHLAATPRHQEEANRHQDEDEEGDELGHTVQHRRHRLAVGGAGLDRREGHGGHLDDIAASGVESDGSRHEAFDLVRVGNGRTGRGAIVHHDGDRQLFDGAGRLVGHGHRAVDPVLAQHLTAGVGRVGAVRIGQRPTVHTDDAGRLGGPAVIGLVQRLLAHRDARLRGVGLGLDGRLVEVQRGPHDHRGGAAGGALEQGGDVRLEGPLELPRLAQLAGRDGPGNGAVAGRVQDQATGVHDADAAGLESLDGRGDEERDALDLGRIEGAGGV